MMDLHNKYLNDRLMARRKQKKNDVIISEESRKELSTFLSNSFCSSDERTSSNDC